jgi:hypothetical protein
LATGRRSSKLTAEQLNRLDHCISEARKAWDDRFIVSDPKFLERYMRGEICIHAHFDGSGESGAQKFCATFYGPDHALAPVFWMNWIS